ncbi:MAG TPA: hypothetical protein VL282_06150 [Tepidisphaeraceae bacterium]|jgi:hypothetical protein|nr:hypothetical protein [Tepidisphaeraceae bacterium]
MIAGEWFEQHLSSKTLLVAGILVFGCWWLIAGSWLISGVIALWRRRFWRRWFRWAIAPGVVFFLLASFMPAWHLEFWLSRWFLEDWAQRTTSAAIATSITEQPTWSMIEVNHPQRIAGGVCFYTLVGGHWLDTQGLAYTTQSLPQDVPVNGRYYTPYCKNWYTFWEP